MFSPLLYSNLVFYICYLCIISENIIKNQPIKHLIYSVYTCFQFLAWFQAKQQVNKGDGDEKKKMCLLLANFKSGLSPSVLINVESWTFKPHLCYYAPINQTISTIKMLSKFVSYTY